FAHNDNGVLEPGERALMLMSVSFSGQFSNVGFAPALGSFSHGTVLGLAFCYMDIRGLTGDASGLYNGGITSPTSVSTGPNADTSGTGGYGVRGGWRLGGDIANGSPVADGFANISPGQLPINPTLCNEANPVANTVRLGWAPASYSQRTQV